MKLKDLAILIFSLITAVVFTRLAMAASLAWDPNPPGDNVTAYKIWEHIGTNYNLIATTGPSPSPTGSPIQYSFPLPSPVPQGTPRIFTVTAVNTGGESARATPEASWTPVPTPTPTPNPPSNLHLIP